MKNFEIERYERKRTINVMIFFKSIMGISSTINVNSAAKCQITTLKIA
jgi:hypothetical protein